MPRDSGGLYSLPPGNPVIPETIIETDWANPTMADISAEMSDSLSRSGKGGMLAALRCLDGSAAVPSLSWTNEPATGRYRDGPNQIVEAVDGNKVMKYDALGVYQWKGDQNTGSWEPLTPRDALGTPFDPGPSNLTSTNVQDAIEEVNDKIAQQGGVEAKDVLFDDQFVYFGAATVQRAIEVLATDLAAAANDILDNADAILINTGEISLLQGRVTTNETTIGDHETRIGLLETELGAEGGVNDRLDDLDADVAAIKLEQTQQNSDIQLNTDKFDALDPQVQQNKTDIAAHDNRIYANEQTLISHGTRLDDAEGTLQNHEGRIATNESNIQANTDALAYSVGTGKLVRQNDAISLIRPRIDFGDIRGSTWLNGTIITAAIDDPTISNGDAYDLYSHRERHNDGWVNRGTLTDCQINDSNLNSNCTVTNPPLEANGNEIVSASWLRSVMGNEDVVSMSTGSNSSGWWLRLERVNSGNRLIQWGQALPGGGTVTVNWPTAFSDESSIHVVTSVTQVNNSGGVDMTSAVYHQNQLTTTSCGFTSNRQFHWIAIGFGS